METLNEMKLKTHIGIEGDRLLQGRDTHSFQNFLWLPVIIFIRYILYRGEKGKRKKKIQTAL